MEKSKDSETTTKPSFQEIGTELGRFVDDKNKAYGNAFGKSAEFLALLYPNGIPPEQYRNMILFVRMFDKLNRIATHRDAFGEDPAADVLGLVLRLIHQEQQDKEKGDNRP